MELQKYMRGGLDVSEAEVDSLWTPYAVAQRALDAERHSKQCDMETLTLKFTSQLASLQARCAHLDVLLRDEYLPKLDVVAVQRSIADRDSRIDALEREVEKLDDDKETLQAQLAAMTESRDAWRLAQECSEKAYMSLATQIPSERYDYDPVNLALLDGAKEQERIGRKQIADLQAQLRQVEGQSKTQAEEAVIVFAKYTTLRQLVAALPVVDVQEVSVWLSPDESGWLVSKRPAFPAGLYWAKFRTQAEADSFRALLAYRATLVVQDAPQPAPNERVEYAQLELAALFSTPGAPTLEQAKLVCENKNPADAQCILNAYEALREAAQDAGKEDVSHD